MASGGYSGVPGGAGQLARGDQRSLGRAAYAPRAGSGLMSVQNDDTGDWLKYLADVGRGVDPQPRTRGFHGVQRR